MLKRFVIAAIILVVLLVCAGIVGFNLFREKMIAEYFATAKPQPVTVSTYKVEPMGWTPGIEAIGTVAAANGVDLTVETTGIVQDINFSSNQRVDQNSVLVQLDNEVEQADLEAGKTRSRLDKLALDRALQLQKSGVGTQSTLDTARAAAETSASEVAKLQAVLDQKQLRAPFGGTMGIPRVELGQFLQPGTVVATLQNLDTMRADFAVPEHQLGELYIGQQVTFGLDENAAGFSGKIMGIEPKVDASSRLVSVRAIISNPNGKLSPGQFVQVRVELAREDSVIAIPETALTTSLYGDFVFVVRPAQTEPAKAPEGQTPAPAEGEKATPAEQSLAVYQVFVTPGRRSKGIVEILNNLKAGDEVVTAGQNRLANNTPVTVDNTVEPLSKNGGAAK